MECFLLTGGGQRAERLLSSLMIVQYVRLAWSASRRRPLVAACRSSGMGQKDIRWRRGVFPAMRGGQRAERFLSSLMIVLDLARSWLYACKYLNNYMYIFASPSFEGLLNLCT